MNIWKGTWKSQQYSPLFVNGTVEVELPNFDNPKDIQPFETKAAIKYCGGYRRGARVLLDISSDGSSGTSKQHIMAFKASLQEQQIEFRCETIDQKHITGTYTTYNPSDNGEFALDLTDDASLDRSELQGSGCVIV